MRPSADGNANYVDVIAPAMDRQQLLALFLTGLMVVSMIAYGSLIIL